MTGCERGSNPSADEQNPGAGATGVRRTCRRAGSVAVVLLVVLSFGLSIGVPSGASPQPTDSVAENCTTDSGGNAAWHLERYGAGCHDDGFVRFPTGERIDRIGDPPWVPL
ncbi:hypothetical protein [Haladaptatus sp. DYF46]|uniref:hypothetical protein n=1 Tax=Haladaptatus sp. DYF46 TaxID=2886041 RepID=UPI001E506BD6|nr:hypothetical protein [Haladaptatus sp. DYF46]